MENNNARTNRSFKILLVAGALIAGTHLVGSVVPAPAAAAEWASNSSAVTTEVATSEGSPASEQDGWTFKLLNLPIK